MGEVLKADLERVRTCIDQGVIESSILNNINIRYVTHMKRKTSDNVKLDRSVIDLNASKIIERQQIKLNKSLKPISVSADNSCLYNAASLFLTGDETLSLVLRLLTSIEIFRYGDFYASILRGIVESLDIPNNKLSLLKSAFHFASVDHVGEADIASAFKNEAALNCDRNEQSSLVCVMALSSVISSDIESIYSPKCNVGLDKLFSRTFHPRISQSFSRCMTLLWSTTNDVCKYTKPNHFVLCTNLPLKPPANKRAKQSLLPFGKRVKSIAPSENDPPVPSSAKSSALNPVLPTAKQQSLLPFAHQQHPNDAPSNNTPKVNNAPAILVATRKLKKECQNACCSGTLPARGQPVKSPDECHSKDIGLHFDKISKMSEKEKYDILRNVWRPPLDYNFPQHVEHGRHWRINKVYLSESSVQYLPWLIYSAYFDGTFCLPCVAFATHLGKSVSLKKLFTEPFTRWNGAPSRWAEHNASKLHKDCCSTMHTFLSQMESREKRIDEIISETMQKRIAENRKKLIPIIKTIVFCGKQNIALRGHRDDAKHIADKSINSGNFQALLDFRVDSGDTVLRNHFETAPRNATYRSKTIQNEIISCCGDFISDKILTEIKAAKFFSVIADEATDASNKKQMSIYIRFVDAFGEIREEFLEFVHVRDCSAEGIAKDIVNTLEKHGLQIKDLRGQGYDGASTMAGAKGGVAAIILRLNSKALYFWCSGHRLNLVVADTCKIKSVTNMMDSVRKCSQVFEFSSKKQDLLEEQIKSDVTNNENRSKLLNVCRTRWLARLDGLERIQQMFVPITNTLELMRDNHDGSYDSNARADANGLQTTFLSFGFIANLIIVRNILAYITPLTYELQKVKIDILAVYDAVDNVTDTLKTLRSTVDIKHNEWYTQAIDFARDRDVQVKKPRYSNISKFFHRENYDTNSVSDYYKFSLTIPLLDKMLSEFDGRFSKDHRIHSNGFFVIPTKLLAAKGWKSLVKDFTRQYKDDLPNPLRLDSELDLWEHRWIREKSSNPMQVPDNVADTLSYLHNHKIVNWFPNVYVILKLIAVVPGSSCSCERSISRLRLLETYLRSTMGQERLSSLALLYIHYDLDIDNEKVLDIFARKYRHRLQLINILDDTVDV